MPHLTYSLARSRRYARAVARGSGSNFVFAFRLLPPVKRHAMDALYAFMRIADDLGDGDGPAPSKREALARWRAGLGDALAGRPTHPLHPALADAVRRHRIPPGHLHAVIDGVEQDLAFAPPATFAELYAYCYRVASAVGLACIHVWGFRGRAAECRAEAAGVAFQLTNILRDLAEDRGRGRVYLPAEDCERFACPPEKWGDTPEFAELLAFQAGRAERYYEAAEPLEGHLDVDGRPIWRLMTRTYRELLDRVRRAGPDVLRRRVSVGRWRKLRLAIGAVAPR